MSYIIYTPQSTFKIEGEARDNYYEHWEEQNRFLLIYARLIDFETQEILGIKYIYNHWKKP